MLILATDADFAALVAGTALPGLAIAPGGIEGAEILAMLRGLSAEIGASFTPNAWLMVKDDEIAGLVSITSAPKDGAIDIGYGVAASRRRRGIARSAIAELVAWANGDPRVTAITAATSPDNPASQRVLAANGFARIGTTIDPEDGPLILWRSETAAGRAATPAAD
ncbi:MAG: GNAT family N-acetyltransferase [Sandarakinorhabdus sp.]|nr:GNAT family N-acetyltransferase [Sandarakinorhabdus sp.]